MFVYRYVCMYFIRSTTERTSFRHERKVSTEFCNRHKARTYPPPIPVCLRSAHTHTLGSRLNSALTRTYIHSKTPTTTTTTTQRSTAHHVPMYSRAIVSSFRCFVISSSSFRCLLDSLRFAFRLRRCRRCCRCCRQHRFRGYVCV